MHSLGQHSPDALDWPSFPESSVDQTSCPFETTLPPAGDTLGGTSLQRVCIPSRNSSTCSSSSNKQQKKQATAASSSRKTSPADMAHAGMAPCRRLTQTDLASASAYLHNHQASSAISAPRKRPRFNREQGVVAAKVRSVAAYSVLILQLLLLLQELLQALLQASGVASKRCCKQASLQASAACYYKRAYHRRQGSDLRSYDALFITVEPCFGRCCGAETALLAWRLWRYEDDRMPRRFASSVDWGYSSTCVGRREFGTRALSHFCFICRSAWWRTKRATKK